MAPSMLETEIIIDSSPEHVKAVFMDWAQYPVWNPFIKSLSLTKGNLDNPEASFTQLKACIQVEENKSGMIFTPQLLINSESEFRWAGTFLGKCFLLGEHWFQFLPSADGTKTRFVHGESFTGLGVGLFKLLVSMEKTEKGFMAMNEALKKRVENEIYENSK